jgi:large subunit ribosomal protein L5
MPIALQEKYRKEVLPHLKEKFSQKADLAVPRITKIVVNSGVGRLRDDKQMQEVEKYLGLITGQKPVACTAKQAIASFKSRKGLVIGYKVTLRGKRMYDFLQRMVQLAIPRTRDFRGINRSAIDQAGNLTIGVKEHIVFPETIGEDIHTIFGFEATIVTTAKNRVEAMELFTSLGIPLQKE